jgi:hypothetical protein
LRTDYRFVPHQIIELTNFFAPYLLRHLTSDKRNVVTYYNVSVGARGSKNFRSTTTESFLHDICTDVSIFGHLILSLICCKRMSTVSGQGNPETLYLLTLF